MGKVFVGYKMISEYLPKAERYGIVVESIPSL